MSSALTEILRNGVRAWAKGFTFMVGDTPYGIYFVRYEPTLLENQKGRYN